MDQKRRLVRFRALTRNVSTSTTVGLWICMVTSLCLFVASLFIPPQGEIHPSVLQAVGWIFAFAALFELREAIREGLGFKLTHGKTVVEVKDLDGKAALVEKENSDDDAET